jgi:hypothetical protein
LAGVGQKPGVFGKFEPSKAGESRQITEDPFSKHFIVQAGFSSL